MNILKENGIFAFICSNKFTKAKYGEKLRKLLLTRQIKIFDDFNGIKVFKEAQVDTCIIQIKKDYPNSHEIFVNQEYYMEQNFLSSEVFSFEKPEILELKQKLIKENTILEDLNIEINYGIKTGLNEAFIINKETKNALISKDSKNKEIIKPVLRGKDVKKGSINFAELYLLYIPWNFKIEDYPSIKEYLIPFEKKLSKRPAVKTKKHEWFALSSYASNCLENFDKPKLIYPDISQGIFAVYDDEHYYINDRCFMITHSNNDINFLKALACIFSSDLLNFIFKISGALLGSSGFKLAKVHVKNLPICNLSEDNKILLANLYDEFYIANKIKNEKEIINNIKIIENQINQTLYSLYGLNEDEIKIIENNLK